MGIIVKIHNKKGDWIKMDRACFGFLSHINCWDEDDVESHSKGCNPKGYNGLPGFSSDDLQSIEYIEDCETPELLSNLRKAMAGLPQYYSDFSIDEKTYGRIHIHIPVEDVCMQVPVVGGMMLRNILAYSNFRRSFEQLIEKGVDQPTAFIIAQAFPHRHNGFEKDKCGLYRSTGGDESIFSSDARLCDVINALKGNLGDDWQGKFGDTEEGYGRYGNYGDEEAPDSLRGRRSKTLTDIVFVKEKKIWETSPLLNSVMFEGCGVMEDGCRLFLTVDAFVEKLYPKIQELLK